MVTAKSYVKLSSGHHHHIFHFPAGLFPYKMQVFFLGQQIRAALKYRRNFLRGRNSELFLQLPDMLHGFLHIPACIADGEYLIIIYFFLLRTVFRH